MKSQHMVPLYHLELVRDKNIPYSPASKEEEAAAIFHQMLDSSPVEKLAVIHVTSGAKMIGAEVIAMGNIDAVGAQMTEMFRGAINNNAAMIWVAHNHVDGDTTASPADYRFTVRLMDGATLLGVKIIDHLVVGPGSHFSILRHQDELSRYAKELDQADILAKIRAMVPMMPGFEIPNF